MCGWQLMSGRAEGTCEIGAGLDVLKWTCLVAPFSGVVLTKKGEDWIDWGCRWMQYGCSMKQVHWKSMRNFRMLRSGMKSLAPGQEPSLAFDLSSLAQGSWKTTFL